MAQRVSIIVSDCSPSARTVGAGVAMSSHDQ
jgi:hypothetical protein